MSTEFLANVYELDSGELVSQVFKDITMEKGNPTDPKQRPLPEGAPPVPSISIDHNESTISFKLQCGPIKEVGKNGCQVDDIVATAIEFLKAANQIYPCKENDNAIAKFKEGIFWLEERKRDRSKRGVEGTNML